MSVVLSEQDAGPHRLRSAIGPDRVVVVTGGASGIGAAIVDRLVATGTTAVVVDRIDQDPRDGVHPVRADVTDPEQATEAVRSITEAHGGIDGLVTSAAISGVRRVEDYDHATVMGELEVNFGGTALWISAVTPVLRARGGGRIVTIGSQLAERPIRGLGYYSAAKAALIALTKVAAVELVGDGIAVNCLCPGPTDTPLTRKLPDRPREADPVSRLPIGRRADPTEIADPVVFLLGEGASFITGTTLQVDGGYCAV